MAGAVLAVPGLLAGGFGDGRDRDLRGNSAVADYAMSAEDRAAAKIEAEKFERVSAMARAEMPKGLAAASEPDAEEKAAIARDLTGTPVGFATRVLGLKLYDWQAEALSWFEDTFELVKGSLCTPNGAGKSAYVDAALALWWITVHPQGRVVITTKDSKQLDNQLWPAIERHKDKFPQYDFIERMVRNNTGGFIIGFTTDDPGRAEGWHKIDDRNGPLLMILDEAKSIIDGIHMATDRCTYNAKLQSSSPGLTEGLFYKSTLPDSGYLSMRVGLDQCPHIPKSRIDDIIKTYGPDHWFTRSTLHAEFTDVDSDTLLVVPRSIVIEAMGIEGHKAPRYVVGGQRAFLDFAAGRNENVFTLRKGNQIIQESWKDPDPMRAVYRFIQLFVKYSLLPSEIKGDAGGMGIPILARFNELGWPIIGVNNESEARDTVKYPNKGAEMWHNLLTKLPGMILPDDPILLEQLCRRRAEPVGAQLGLETKKKLIARGGVSPDRGDGVAGVMDDDIDGSTTLFDQDGLGKLEESARAAQRVEAGKLESGSQGITFTVSLDGWLTVFERPIIGHSYVCVINPHRHDEPMTNHTLIVVRGPFFEEKEGVMRPARLAAKVRVTPFRLDAGPLVEMLEKISSWYGNCIVVPIVNDRGDLIERMLSKGLHTYAREDFESSKHGRAQAAVKFGWVSDDFTRSMWIGSLAEQIREDKIIVEDVGTVMQLFQLDGKTKMMREAEALGVGVQLLNYATTYIAPMNNRPWSVSDLEGGEKSNPMYS